MRPRPILVPTAVLVAAVAAVAAVLGAGALAACSRERADAGPRIGRDDLAAAKRTLDAALARAEGRPWAIFQTIVVEPFGAVSHDDVQAIMNARGPDLARCADLSENRILALVVVDAQGRAAVAAFDDALVRHPRVEPCLAAIFAGRPFGTPRGPARIMFVPRLLGARP